MTAPAPRADQAARFTATTRDGRSVSIEVTPIEGTSSYRGIYTCGEYRNGVNVAFGPPENVVREVVIAMCTQGLRTYPVEVLAHDDPPRAALLAQVAGLRGALERVCEEARADLPRGVSEVGRRMVVVEIASAALLAPKAGT